MREYTLRERPHLRELIARLLPDWWWSWYFDASSLEPFPPTRLLVQLTDRAELGDLRDLRNQDARREATSIEVDAAELEGLYENATRPNAEGRVIESRPQQREMSERVLKALNRQERVAIEAPTGTGKSLAYLVPGVLWARKTGVPLVVSTHSKSLQDQLLEKDIPKARSITGFGDLKASTVKGQENYLCLRKLSDWAESLGTDAPLEERWCAAYLVAFHAISRVAELDRLSPYLRRRFESLGASIERTRSHHTTTIGPGCPFYKTCHFYDSARLAHTSDVIIANHALLFQWPSHLPAVRSVVFDEAHHLEERLTESFSARLSEVEITETLDRLERKRSGRRADDLSQLAGLLTRLELGGRYSDQDAARELPPLFGAIRTRVNELRALAPGFVPRNREGQEGYEENRVLNGGPSERAWIEGIRNLEASLREVRDWLIEASLAAERRKHPKTDPLLDLLANTTERFTHFTDQIGRTIPPDEPTEETANFLRLLHWEPREQIWKVSAQPIDVSRIAAPFFRQMSAVVLTSATLSAGANPSFITDRIGLDLTEKLTQLPSPYSLEKQAVALIPTGLPPPGTLAHVDSLVRFTAGAARHFRGRTLLLISSNRRLKHAAEALRAELEPEGITVLDSLSDKRAADTFRQTEQAVLVGGERYGEGLDIPGDALSCVIIEKINEAMTRGPLAEARKARTKFPLYDYDFPLRMIWLKQRVGRLIRSPTDRGVVVIYDSRFHQWSAASKSHVVKSIAPIPIRAGEPDQLLSVLAGAASRSSSRRS